MKHIFIIFILISPLSVNSETLWKLGVGLGNVTANSYPGSNETKTITSPIPYFNIKTKWFDLDREGLHTNWFTQTNFRLDFSFDFGLPVNSQEVQLRKGMPDLDTVGQVGPVLVYQLIDDRKLKWQLQWPVTFAYAINESLEMKEVGWLSNPRVYFNYLHNDKKFPLDISISFGPLYGSKKYHQYYYEVLPEFVDVNRNEYLTDEGFAGYRFNFSASQRMNGYWLGLYVRYQNLSDAVFINSPLVNHKDYWFMGVGASWLFAGNL